jgi:hypothetical protein
MYSRNFVLGIGYQGFFSDVDSARASAYSNSSGMRRDLNSLARKESTFCI